jgi:FtsX-like permease family
MRPALPVLACAVGVVMLIVCANLSNLQLARMGTRQKEMAVRAALGAGRPRLLRQMLTESVALSCCGAALGLILAVAGTRALAHLDAFNIPLLGSVRIDGGGLGFTLLAAVVTGVLFALLPAIQVPAYAVQEALKDNSRGSSGGRRHAWIRNGLVVSEIAFACILLVGAGLPIRSFLRVLDVNLGFHPDRAAAIRIDPSSQYSSRTQRNAYFDEALRRTRSIPGIVAAGLTVRDRFMQRDGSPTAKMTCRTG